MQGEGRGPQKKNPLPQAGEGRVRRVMSSQSDALVLAARHPHPDRLPKPGEPAAKGSERETGLCRLLLDRLRLRAGGDGDRPRLHRLGDLADQLDMQHAVIEAGADHLDGVGELEAALEGAAGDAAVEVLRGVLLLLGLAGDQQRVLLDLDVEIAGAEAGDGHAQAIGFIAGLLDVVGRIGRGAVGARGRIDQARQAVEADGGTEQRGKIERIHAISSDEQHGNGACRNGRAPGVLSDPPRASDTSDIIIPGMGSRGLGVTFSGLAKVKTIGSYSGWIGVGLWRSARRRRLSSTRPMTRRWVSSSRSATMSWRTSRSTAAAPRRGPGPSCAARRCGGPPR